MTKSELIELLEDYDDDCEIRIATQPSWPFENTLTDVVAEELLDLEEWIGETYEKTWEDYRELDEEIRDKIQDEYYEYLNGQGENSIVYLATSHQIGYLPGQIAKKLGW